MATIERRPGLWCMLAKLRPYLWGADFKIFTDHKPLLSLFKQEVKNTKIQRWAVLIAEFGAPILHIQGKKISKLTCCQGQNCCTDTREGDECDIPDEDPLYTVDGFSLDQLRQSQEIEFAAEIESAKRMMIQNLW